MTEVTFDKAAAAYDRFMGRWSRLYIPALISAMQIKPGDRVLDVAAGTGEAAFACAAVVGARTVKDLVAGSDLRFDNRGLQMLKGIPGEWRLFAVDQQQSAVARA